MLGSTFLGDRASRLGARRWPPRSALSAWPFRQAQHALGDDVALDFSRAAGDCLGECVEIVVTPTMHADDLGPVYAIQVDRCRCHTLRKFREAQAHDRPRCIGYRILR